MIGYKQNREIQPESFFLVCLNQENRFILREFSQGNTSTLISIPLEENQKSRLIDLKVRCLGPRIMIYYKQVLLKAWINDKIIRGRIGLFADPYNSVMFKNIKIIELANHAIP